MGMGCMVVCVVMQSALQPLHGAVQHEAAAQRGNKRLCRVGGAGIPPRWF